jgi:hypothetical protein
MPTVRGDEEVIKHMRIFGAIVVVLLVTLNVLFLAFMLGSSGMQETTTKMYDLSVDMNHSTTRTMGRLFELTESIRANQTHSLVSNALQISEDVLVITRSLARSGNFSSLATGAKDLVASIDAKALGTALGDAAAITRTLTGSSQRVSQVVELLDPDEIRKMLADVLNVTAELRRVVTSHNVRLNF